MAPSLPLHYLLYRAFGWSDSQPEFAHLPLLLKPTGGGKLSKRDGDKMGFPVFPLRWVSPDGETAHGYREDGYFPEAFVNMLALLGWNPGTEQEIFSMDELIGAFLARTGQQKRRPVQPRKSPLVQRTVPAREKRCRTGRNTDARAEGKGNRSGKGSAEKAVALIKERATFPQELWNLSWFLFKAPEEYEEKGVAKFWKGENPARIAALREVIAGIDDFTKENAERIVHDWIVAREYPMGQVMNSLRLTLVGAGSGPSIFDICEIIGKEETLRRIDAALDKLGRQAIG